MAHAANPNAKATLSEEHLGSAVEIAYETYELPAIPYEGWCDRVAEMLSDKSPRCIVAVTVASFEPSGAIREVLCEGVRLPDELADERANGPRITKSDLASLNWWIRTDTQPAVAQLRALPTNPDWTNSPAGKQWSSYGINDMLVGLSKLPGAHDDRSIVIEFGFFQDDDKLCGGCSIVLGSVMPLLGARAGLAFNMSESLNMITNRELDVLQHLAVGKSVKQIAAALDRSEHTIHDHVKSLHKKLNASSRGELVARALGHLSPENSIKVLPNIRPSLATNRASHINGSDVAEPDESRPGR